MDNEKIPNITIINSNTNNNNAVVRSKSICLILCIFLGCLGVHRFYVGKNVTGILYLITFGLMGIGVVFDFILILSGAFRDKSGNTLS